MQPLPGLLRKQCLLLLLLLLLLPLMLLLLLLLLPITDGSLALLPPSPGCTKSGSHCNPLFAADAPHMEHVCCCRSVHCLVANASHHQADAWSCSLAAPGGHLRHVNTVPSHTQVHIVCTACPHTHAHAADQSTHTYNVHGWVDCGSQTWHTPAFPCNARCGECCRMMHSHLHGPALTGVLNLVCRSDKTDAIASRLDGLWLKVRRAKKAYDTALENLRDVEAAAGERLAKAVNSTVLLAALDANPEVPHPKYIHTTNALCCVRVVRVVLRGL
jgi:predicted nucleic-acid-binding Zn-ribbon protein